jgi:peptide/nickel transport system substrate-binding protein
MAQEKVLRAVLHADVRVLDPIWTTQTIANIHGMLVYDTLFGNDADMQPKPQMVDKVDITEDKLVYTFTLRDKLKFHDGSPVTSNDVIASLGRWGKKDGVGQRLYSFVDKVEAVDAKTFRMTLTKPYGHGAGVARQDQLLGGRHHARPGCGDRPAAAGEGGDRLRSLQVRQGPVGAGQQGGLSQERRLCVAAQQREGRELRRLQVPRRRPHRARVDLRPADRHVGAHQRRDRLLREPQHRLLPILEKAKGVKLMRTGKLDSTHGMIRLNHLHPPFNNVKARQAMYYLINQENFLRAIVGDPKYYRICHGLITCGSPLGNDGGSHWFKEYNPKKALQLLKEAGYNGEPITVLAATDHNTITPAPRC